LPPTGASNYSFNLLFYRAVAPTGAGLINIDTDSSSEHLWSGDQERRRLNPVTLFLF
jgi:hypothetical protein